MYTVENFFLFVFQRLYTINLSQSKPFSRRRQTQTTFEHDRESFTSCWLVNGPVRQSWAALTGDWNHRLGIRCAGRRSDMSNSHTTRRSRDVCTCNPSREGAGMKFKTLAWSWIFVILRGKCWQYDSWCTGRNNSSWLLLIRHLTGKYSTSMHKHLSCSRNNVTFY